MKLSDRVRRAVARRLDGIEAALARIDGLTIERRGDAIRVRGRRLIQRSIGDLRLRFAGLTR